MSNNYNLYFLTIISFFMTTKLYVKSYHLFCWSITSFLNIHVVSFFQIARPLVLSDFKEVYLETRHCAFTIYELRDVELVATRSSSKIYEAPERACFGWDDVFRAYCRTSIFFYLRLFIMRHIGIPLLLGIVYTENREHRSAGCRGVAYVTRTYVSPLDEQREYSPFSYSW